MFSNQLALSEKNLISTLIALLPSFLSFLSSVMIVPYFVVVLHLFHTLDKPLYWNVAGDKDHKLRKNIGFVVSSEVYLRFRRKPVRWLRLHVFVEVARSHDVSVW